MKKTGKKIIVALFAFMCVALCGALWVVVKYGPYFNFYIAPPSTQKYVQIALDAMGNGIYANGEEWEAKKASVLEEAKNRRDYADTYDLLNEALAVAGGKHSMLVVPEDGETDAASAEQEIPTVTMDEQGIMYVKLPGFLGTDGAQQYADTVVGYVKENPERIKGVIVDLRDNTGGNLGPMVAALSPFLPDGELLSFRIMGSDRPVVLSEGTVTGGGSNLTVEAVKVSEVPVAILQNEWTASSGEAALLAFRGLDYAKTFGEPTAGYCSCNMTYSLYDGAIMQLTVGSNVARTGQEFCEDPIVPDVESETPQESAKEWILGNK